VEGRPEQYRTQEALAVDVGVTRQTVSSFETDETTPRGRELQQLARCLGVSMEWILEGDQGHRVVSPTGDIEYDPNPDPEGTPAEQLMAFLGMRVGMRRLAGELTAKDLIVVAYTLARSEGFAPEEFKKLDRWRDQILEEERGGRG
jgi:transcriptional regulator with XRE-family HTH domain